MVNVVLAGGAGNIGRELVEELQRQGKHHVTILSRSSNSQLTEEGVNVVQVDYLDKAQLVRALQGAHTVLNFTLVPDDPRPHHNLIDACVEAGVKRYAPTEWAAKSNCGWEPYKWKDGVKDYLESVNKDQKVLEYCLFQPGYFMEYLLFPKAKSKYMMGTSIGYDLGTGNAILTDRGDDYRVFTTVKDFVTIVSKALDYEGVWPERGGMQGDRVQAKEIIRLIQKYNAEPMKVHQLYTEDLEKGKYKADWYPPLQHPSFTDVMTPEFVKAFLCGFEVANVKNGCLDVSGEWNKIFPDYHFTSLEELCKEVLQ